MSHASGLPPCSLIIIDNLRNMLPALVGRRVQTTDRQATSYTVAARKCGAGNRARIKFANFRPNLRPNRLSPKQEPKLTDRGRLHYSIVRLDQREATAAARCRPHFLPIVPALCGEVPPVGCLRPLASLPECHAPLTAMCAISYRYPTRQHLSSQGW